MNTKSTSKRFSPLHIVALVCAFLIFAAIVATTVIIIVNATKNEEFDYLKSDLSKYITLTEEDYSTITGKLDIAKDREVDFEHQILKLVASQKNKDSASDKQNGNVTITAGDEVELYYRGYVIGEDGEKEYLDGMTNIAASSLSATTLEIGGGSFIPGFELALIGKTADQFPTLEDYIVKSETDSETTLGDVLDGTETDSTQYGYIVVTYSRSPLSTNPYSGVVTEGTSESGTVLLNMNDETAVNELLGEGFYNILTTNKAHYKLDGANIFPNTSSSETYDDHHEVDLDGTTYRYTSFKINFAFRDAFEDDAVKAAAEIEVQFPYNYSSEELAGKTAYFQIYVDTVTEYGYSYNDTDNYAADLTDETFLSAIITKALEDDDAEITVDELAEKYADKTTVYEQYLQYIRDESAKDYDKSYKAALKQQILDCLVDKVTGKEDFDSEKIYAIAGFDKKYNDNLISFRESYESYKSNYSSYIPSDYSIEDYAEDMLEIEDGYKWQDGVKDVTRDTYVERMIVYSILKAKVSDYKDKYDARYAALCAELSDEYKESYCEENDIDLDDMTPQEKEKVDDAVDSYLYELGYDYIIERTYYELVIDWVLENADLTGITVFEY